MPLRFAGADLSCDHYAIYFDDRTLNKEEALNRDGSDAQLLYDVLEQEIIPLYYRVSADGIPEGWINVMKESIRSNAPLFSTRRMIKEYISKFYIPALRSVYSQ